MRLSHLLRLRQKTPRERGVTRRRGAGPFCQSGNRTLSPRTPPAEKWEQRKRCRARMRGATRAPPGEDDVIGCRLISALRVDVSICGSLNRRTLWLCRHVAFVTRSTWGLAGGACSNLSTPPGNSPNSLLRFPNRTISLQVQ